MKILRNPRAVPKRDNKKFIEEMMKKYRHWSLVVVCPIDRRGCGAELKIALKDIKCHTYERDCLSADPLYAAIVCPVCHESMRLSGKIPEELEELVVLTKKPRNTADLEDYED